MARPRSPENAHLPKYVKVIHGSYWFCPPKGQAVRISRVGDDQALYRFMMDKAEPSGPVTFMNDVFDRYEREILPTLGERTQKDYLKHLKTLRKVFGALRPDD